MATKTENTSTAVAERPRDRRPRAFEAPPEFPPAAGVQFADEKMIQGVVSTDNIRALLDAFGLQNREQISIPFHHIKAQRGERWSLRVEAPAVHNVEGKVVVGHTWIYRRDHPEESVGE